MSRIAKKPVMIAKEVDVSLDNRKLTVKGPKGSMQHTIHDSVTVSKLDSEDKEFPQLLQFAPSNGSKMANAMAGTERALVNNMVTGVSQGFEQQLDLKGVGYRAQVQGKVLNLHLGYSHPIAYAFPDGVTVETPANTTIIVKAIDKQILGQICAEIRAFRPPEPYKGKGICYAGERIVRKETKKK